MRLTCNINGSQYSLVVNSDKPLNQILKEHIISFAENSQCMGASCGNCIAPYGQSLTQAPHFMHSSLMLLLSAGSISPSGQTAAQMPQPVQASVGNGRFGLRLLSRTPCIPIMP